MTAVKVSDLFFNECNGVITLIDRKLLDIHRLPMIFIHINEVGPRYTVIDNKGITHVVTSLPLVARLAVYAYFESIRFQFDR